MTFPEYENIQARLRHKLKEAIPLEYSYGKRREGYEAGLLAAMSIFKSVYTYKLSKKEESK